MNNQMNNEKEKNSKEQRSGLITCAFDFRHYESKTKEIYTVVLYNALSNSTDKSKKFKIKTSGSYRLCPRIPLIKGKKSESKLLALIDCALEFP